MEVEPIDEPLTYVEKCRDILYVLRQKSKFVSPTHFLINKSLNLYIYIYLNTSFNLQNYIKLIQNRSTKNQLFYVHWLT